MRILLDECVPARLRHEFPGHDTTTVGRMRWSGMADVALMRRASREFDVLITVDQSLASHAPADARIAIITIRSRSIEFHALQPLVPEILEILQSLQPGDRGQVGPL